MTDQRGELWQIMVPCQSNDGKPFKTRHHREWDRQVMLITGGLTVMRPSIGQWKHDGDLFKERMIPVQIMATEEQMRDIAERVIKHYDQLAAFYFRVSEICVIQHKRGE